MVGERLGDRTHLCANVVGLFLALHGLSLQPILALTHIMVYEYSRNDFRGQQARERTKEKGGYGPGAMSWVSVRTMRYIKRVIRSCGLRLTAWRATREKRTRDSLRLIVQSQDGWEGKTAIGAHSHSCMCHHG